MENKREDILAEINMLKILVWKLYGDMYGNIDNDDWNLLKEKVIKLMNDDKKI